MIRPLLILCTILTLPLRANLGETVAQCVARYGRPSGYSEASAAFPFGTVAFSSGGYMLIVFLVGDKEVGARVSKVDKSAFSTAEMQSIMNADQAGPWAPLTGGDARYLRWSRDDQATVLYDMEKRMLVFTSEQMAHAINAIVAKPGATK